MTETYHIEKQAVRTPKCPKHGTRLVLPNFSTRQVCLKCSPMYARPCGICRVARHACAC